MTLNFKSQFPVNCLSIDILSLHFYACFGNIRFVSVFIYTVYGLYCHQFQPAM